MNKTQKSQAEKLQTKLDKLLQTKEKRQHAYDKAKQELTTVSKEVDGVKLKLFEILQSGSDDTAFSSWAKRKIGESGNSAKSENANSEKSENGKSAKAEKLVSQKHQQQAEQSNKPPTQQNQNQRQ